MLWQIYRPEKHQTRTSILSYNIPGPLSMLLGAWSLWLTTSRPSLVAWALDPEAWSLKLVTVDHDPGTKLGPVIGHDLELSRDGLQLARARVTNFYFKLFHIFFLLTISVIFRICHAKSPTSSTCLLSIRIIFFIFSLSLILSFLRIILNCQHATTHLLWTILAIGVYTHQLKWPSSSRQQLRALCH